MEVCPDCKMITVGLFVPIPSTCPEISVIPWRAPLLDDGAMRATVLMLSRRPLHGGVVNDQLGGGGTSGGLEVVVAVIISNIWVSGNEVDSWSRRGVPWSRRTVAWKTGTELHIVHKATGDCGV